MTRNYELFRVSANFFSQRRAGRAVPNCVLDSPFTTLVWLHEPLSAPDLPRERILADAYSAMNPGDPLWEAFNDEIDRLRATGSFSEEDAHVLQLSQESSHELMDMTLGGVEPYVEGTALQVLERAQQNLRAELEVEVAKERSGREEAEQQLAARREAIEERGRKIGRVAARGVFSVLVPILVIGVVFGPLGPLADAWSPLPGFLQALCTVAVVLLTLWSFVEGISVRHIAERFATVVERRAVALLEHLAEPGPD